MEIYFTILSIIELCLIMSWISVRYCTYITLLIPAAFNSTMREMTAKHLFNIAYIYINSHNPSDQISDYKQREWLLSLWPSLHIGASRAERCVTRLYLTFRCSWQSCPFPNCCIVTRIYYCHVFWSHSALVLFFSERSRSHPRRVPTQTSKAWCT